MMPIDFEREMGAVKQSGGADVIQFPYKSTPTASKRRKSKPPTWLTKMADKHGRELAAIPKELDTLYGKGREYKATARRSRELTFQMLIDMGNLELAVEKSGKREEMTDRARKHLDDRGKYKGQKFIMLVMEGYYGVGNSTASRNSDLVLHMLREGVAPRKFGGFIKDAGGLVKARDLAKAQQALPTSLGAPSKSKSVRGQDAGAEKPMVDGKATSAAGASDRVVKGKWTHARSVKAAKAKTATPRDQLGDQLRNISAVVKDQQQVPLGKGSWASAAVNDLDDYRHVVLYVYVSKHADDWNA
ncbi:MAG: hypothetical protein K2P94_08510 [Rhodospirillaceae bacterium]|nr:hypothetical protein [Rhodospirillaceae bacterium]